jgi:hypothetical protein
MTRTPPVDVRRTLRREVGFVCPIPGCTNPYLTWHHFDPPWRVREHHEPGGLIALCKDHHSQADEGAFTVDQLRQMKRDGLAKAEGEAIKEVFNWRRQRLVAIVGGNFILDCLQLVWYRSEPCMWLTRDDEDLLSLNVRMPTISAEPRMHIENNGWICAGLPRDLECSPGGNFLRVRYSNDDDLAVRFSNCENPDQFRKMFPQAPEHMLAELPFPLTSVEITGRVGGTDLRYSSTAVQYGKNLQIQSNFIAETLFPALTIIHPEDQLSPFIRGVIKFMLLPPVPLIRLSSDIE